jgi:ribosome maturation factor RimP
LNGAKAYITEEGTVFVGVGNDFALRMLESKNASDALSAILMNKEGIRAKVVLQISTPASEKKEDALDELTS